jgi:MFS family permease
MTNRQKWVLVLTSIASLMVALDVTVVSTALSSIRLHLHASIDELEWTVNAYGLSFAVLLMTGSSLGDRFGRRRLFVSGLALFVVASAACALSTDVGFLVAARAVQGACAAIIAPVSLAILTAAFPPDRRGQALGIFSGITGLAVVAGPVIGGAVTQGLAWQWIFWLNVPIGLAAIPLVLNRLEETRGPKAALDLPGLALVTGAALGIVWGLVRGNDAGWTSHEVLGALITGALLAVAFVLWELRARADAADAAVPIARVRRRQRLEPADVRRAVQRRVLHGSVPAGHARAVAAAHWPAADPVDRDRVHRGPDRGRPR